MILLSLRILCCILIACLTLSMIIDMQNELTELRLKIPILTKEVRELHAQNTGLTYDIERFESPIHLMELSRKPEFGHLKHPYVKDIVILEPQVE